MNLSTRHSRKPFLSKISSYIEYSVSQLLLAIFVGINLFATNISASETFKKRNIVFNSKTPFPRQIHLI